jgi:hypothetical protein
MNAALLLLVAQQAIRVRFDARHARRHLDEPPVTIDESQLAIRVLDAKATLMKRDVVAVADEHQVFERRLTAMRPMLDVMRIHERRMLTPREPTPPVACSKRPEKPRRYRAPPSADIEHAPAFMGLRDDEPAIARDPQQST